MPRCTKCGKEAEATGPYYPVGTVIVKVALPYMGGKSTYEVNGICLDCQAGLAVQLKALMSEYQKEKSPK